MTTGLHTTGPTGLLTAAQALHALNAGTVTATDLVRQCHARIDTIDPVVRAVVTEDRSVALAAAAVQDALRQEAAHSNAPHARRPLGALAGLPWPRACLHGPGQ